MKRLSLVTICIAAIFAVGASAYFVFAQGKQRISEELRSETNQGNALDNATVSFGGWMTSPPLDRFPNVSPPPANHHAINPKMVKIKAGGTVNFIIGGFHHVLVYDDGTQPGDIDTNLTIQPTNGGPPLINDPTNRIYRGLDPSTQPQDRVEVVMFEQPGTYLVLCGVRPHFVNDGMYAFVKVLPKGAGDDDN